MNFRIIENSGKTFTIAGRDGALVRTNNEGRVFVSRDRAFAESALDYLNNKRLPNDGRAVHRIKSMFDV
ncbi:MAG: hypothetical protein ACREO5_13585 [Candidatus Binatia bacterium]